MPVAPGALRRGTSNFLLPEKLAALRNGDQCELDEIGHYNFDPTLPNFSARGTILTVSEDNIQTQSRGRL